jgi:uncharacterized membrane protein HdeD (DUF308 family)
MSKDDRSRKRLLATWRYTRHHGKQAVARTTAWLLKVVGAFGIIYGLLTFALANMDVNPWDSMFSGSLLIFLGLLMLYFGHKIAKKTKKT